jgi:hypothetical protein
MSDGLDRGDKNDETSTDVDASFSCADLWAAVQLTPRIERT